MALDIRYVPTKYFQEIFLDKTTGCPLAGGSVQFFRDSARSVEKDVFILSGTAPNYTYVNIGDTVGLSAAGTFQYNGADVTVYLFPYDSSGNIDLYYGIVEGAGSTSQFTRQGFPNISQEDTEGEELLNFVPNGQFLLHHDIVADEDGNIEAGEITDDVTVIAEGGWTFERTTGSVAKDFVLFERIGSYVETPSKSPRYSARIKNESPGVADVFKNAALKYRDVNKFSSDTQKYTFAFEAKSSGGSSVIEVKLIKNYGTGGSAQEETLLQAITLGSTYQIYDIPFVFGSNDGKTIGSNDDDFVQLVFSLPVASVFDNNFDNVMLLKGDKQVSEFPDTTNAEFIRDSLAGLPPVPDYEGANLYLPMKLGLNGFEYDTNEIGTYKAKSTEDLEVSELWTDGDKYRVAAYSTDKIPYRRLYEKWSANSDIGLSIYGTGDDEMRFIKDNSQDQSFATTDGETDITTSAWQSFTAGNTNKLSHVTFSLGASTTSSIVGNVKIYLGEGTTGDVLATAYGLTFSSGTQTVFFGKQPLLTTGLKYTIEIEKSVGAVYPVGSIFWNTNAAGGYAGGSFNGTAADAVFATYNIVDRSDYLLKSNTGGAVTATADGSIPTGFTFTAVQPDPYIIKIYAIAASGITAGSFFVYNTTDARKNIVWYEKDGVGTKPAETADVYHKVIVITADDANTVVNKTALVINGYSMKTPDWRGYFMRVVDSTSGIDPDSGTRTDRGDERIGDAVGTVQQDENKLHAHTTFGSAGRLSGADATLNDILSGANPTAPSGGHEARSKNIYANWVVKY